MTCATCHLEVARFAAQVVHVDGTYHKECFEQAYMARHNRRPRLLAGGGAERHIYRQIAEVPR